MEFIRKKLGRKNINQEQIWCGQALQHMYEFLNKKPARIPNELIFKMAIDGDKCCREVMNMFLRRFADEIGNIGKRYLPGGGIFLFGGISKGLIPYFMNPEKACPFKQSLFGDKGFLS